MIRNKHQLVHPGWIEKIGQQRQEREDRKLESLVWHGEKRMRSELLFLS